MHVQGLHATARCRACHDARMSIMSTKRFAHLAGRSDVAKVCTKCKVPKTEADFGSDKTFPGGRHPWCKQCRRESQRVRSREPEVRAERARKLHTRRHANVEAKAAHFTKSQMYGLRARYGITIDMLLVMFRLQGGVCAICGAAPRVGMRRGLYVDHDHATGRVRGLLCHGCNIGLGGFRDNTASLAAAARYLEASRAPAEQAAE